MAAGPKFLAVGTRGSSAGAATLTPAKPTVYGQNGLLVAVCSSKNNATHSTVTAGWTKLSQVNSGASYTASVWVAAESAAAPVFTWTGSVAASARMAYYGSPDDALDPNTITYASASGTTSPHTSPSVTTTRDNVRVLFVDSVAINTTLTNPSGWTLDSASGSATDVGSTAFGGKNITTSGSSSGAISTTGGVAAWVQFQLEIRGAALVSGLQVSKLEADAWLEPPPGLAVAKVEIDAWIDVAPPRRRAMPLVN